MTDRQVVVFGSFTEDEIKSLQQRPAETNAAINFGSLDSETLRSVGISNVESRGRPFKLANKQKLVRSVSGTGNTSDKVATTVEQNGCNYDLCAFPLDNEKALTNNVLYGSCLSEKISDSPLLSSLEWHGVEDYTILAKPTKKVVFDSSIAVKPVAFTENIHQASHGPTVSVKSMLPRGLVNLGNLCFLNATLQALLSCSPFVLLLQGLRACKISEIAYPTLGAFVEFISHFDMPIGSSSKRKGISVLDTGTSFRPVMFEPVLKSFSPDVSNCFSGRPRQEDAQEFLSFIMHQMHDELLKLDGQISSSNTGNAFFLSSTNDEDDDEKWETVGRRNKTAITRTQSFIPSKLSAIFGGQLRSVVKARGTKASATIQPFLLLHLNICPEPVCTIEDALRLFSAPETLEGYRTSAAGKDEVVSASKSVKILEPPEIMILHLMRFSYGSEGSTKLHKPVHFPLELVLGRDLLVSPSSEGRRYELVATVTHHGREPSTGHYTADGQHPCGKWLRYNDASVTVIPTSRVLHDQAYILFYKQL